MSEAILKALKWYIMVLAAIVGASAFMISDNAGTVFPVFVGISGFGVVYIMSYFWKDMRGKQLLVSILIFLILTVISNYAAEILYIFAGIDIMDVNRYVVWALTMGALGLPVMTMVFRQFDK